LIGLRFVTHLGVDAAGIDQAVACIHRFMNQPLAKTNMTTVIAGIY
jgi:threonine aldolase